MIDFDFHFATTQSFFQGPSSCQMKYAGPYFETDVASNWLSKKMCLRKWLSITIFCHAQSYLQSKRNVE